MGSKIINGESQHVNRTFCLFSGAAPWKQQAGCSSNTHNGQSKCCLGSFYSKCSTQHKRQRKTYRRRRQKRRHLGWPGSGANPFPLRELSQTSHKNPIFWQITASFGNISSSYIATMHMLMRGIINYSLIWRGFHSTPTGRTSTKLWKGEPRGNRTQLDFGALRHRTAIPEAALLKQSQSRVAPSD